MRNGDIPKVYTAEDVMSRLRGLQQDVKAIRTMNNGLTKTEDKLKEFIKTVLENTTTNQVVTSTWFYSGIPSNETKPEKNWNDEDKLKHLGDLYYDKNSGYGYKYVLENDNYIWQELTINENKVLATANSELDTGDGKRRLYTSIPTTPYETGDIWVNNGVYYRCRTSRSDGDFSSVDWVKSSEYKDEWYLNNIEAVLNQLIVTIETDYATKVSLETTKDSIDAKVNSETTKILTKLNDYANNETVQKQINEMTTKLTDTEFSITSIKESLENGVTQVRTERGYTFGNNGLDINSDNSKVQNLLNEVGMHIIEKNTNENLLFAGYNEELEETVVESKNFIVKKYLIAPHVRIESYNNPTFGEGTGHFNI